MLHADAWKDSFVRDFQVVFVVLLNYFEKIVRFTLTLLDKLSWGNYLPHRQEQPVQNSTPHLSEMELPILLPTSNPSQAMPGVPT